MSFFDFIVAAKGIPLATLDSTFVELIKVCAPYSKDAAIESPRSYLPDDVKSKLSAVYHLVKQSAQSYSFIFT